MAETKSVEMEKLGKGYIDNENMIGARVKAFRATVELKAQAVGDTVLLTKVPKGHAFAYGIEQSSVSLGSATISVGTKDNPAKYAAAHTLTVQTPVVFAAPAPANTRIIVDAEEEILLTVAAAAAPASGMLAIDLFFTSAQ
ncbi:MAG: hypothetical protein LBL00_05980 [Endomicrobium sp.]|jgi:hypothetical protein|nr:hypothetical protein [Endomicrobium sp.]